MLINIFPWTCLSTIEWIWCEHASNVWGKFLFDVYQISDSPNNVQIMFVVIYCNLSAKKQQHQQNYKVKSVKCNNSLFFFLSLCVCRSSKAALNNLITLFQLFWLYNICYCFCCPREFIKHWSITRLPCYCSTLNLRQPYIVWWFQKHHWRHEPRLRGLFLFRFF